MRKCPKCNYPNPDSLSTCFKCATPLDAPAVTQVAAQSAAPTATPFAVPPVAPPATPSAAQAPTAVAAPPVNPNVCSQCAAPAEQSGYHLPLCTTCRDNLSRKSLPAWAIAGCGAILTVLLFALVEFPSSLNGAIAFKRGENAEAARNYTLAASQYQKAAKQFPNSADVIARLGISYYRAGDMRDAMQAFDRLRGKQGSKETIDEANQVIDEINHQLAQPSPTLNR